MLSLQRPVKFPRPPRLHPAGVTFEPAPNSEPASWFGVRAGNTGGAPTERRTFKFQQAVTAKS